MILEQNHRKVTQSCQPTGRHFKLESPGYKTAV